MCVCVYARIENPLISLLSLAQIITNGLVCTIAPFAFIYYTYRHDAREVALWLLFYLCSECHSEWWLLQFSICVCARCEYCAVIYMQVTHQTSACLTYRYREEQERWCSIYEVKFIFLRFWQNYSVCNVCIVSTYASQVPCGKYMYARNNNNNKESNNILSDNGLTCREKLICGSRCKRSTKCACSKQYSATLQHKLSLSLFECIQCRTCSNGKL